jgi:hypothetical protein
MDVLASFPDETSLKKALGSLSERVKDWKELQIYFTTASSALKTDAINEQEYKKYVARTLEFAAFCVPVDFSSTSSFNGALRFAHGKKIIDISMMHRLTAIANDRFTYKKHIDGIQNWLQRNDQAIKKLSNQVTGLKEEYYRFAEACRQMAWKLQADISGVANSVARLRTAFLRKVQFDRNMAMVRGVAGLIGVLPGATSVMEAGAGIMGTMVDFTDIAEVATTFESLGLGDVSETLQNMFLESGEGGEVVLSEDGEELVKSCFTALKMGAIQIGERALGGDPGANFEQQMAKQNSEGVMQMLAITVMSLPTNKSPKLKTTKVEPKLQNQSQAQVQRQARQDNDYQVMVRDRAHSRR